jgi:hypothetical protein
MAVGGTVLFIVSSPKKSEPTRGMRVVPLVSSKEAGLAWMGSF